ncbi:hypothetical protein CR513_47269, partial [Mucuna pruriens]
MKGGVELGGIVSMLTKNDDIITGSQQALPKKCRDLRIFSIPCTIGDCTFFDAMLDLGASINVMPISIYKSLNFGDLEPTGMTIQLANRSVVQPLGVLEDVLVQIDMHVGTLLMESGEHLVQFNIFEAMKHPTKDHSLFGIDIINELVVEHLQLDTNSDAISNFAGDIDVFDCLESITNEADYGKLWEVLNLSESKNDDIDDLGHLSLNSELVDLID